MRSTLYFERKEPFAARQCRANMKHHPSALPGCLLLNRRAYFLLCSDSEALTTDRPTLSCNSFRVLQAAACICVQSSENVPPALERRLVCDLADTMLQKCTTMSVPYSRKSKVVREEVDVGLACMNTLATGDVFTSDSRQLPATNNPE